MTNFKFLPIALLFTGLMFLTSCGSDVDCNDASVFNEFNRISEDVVEVGFTFTDPNDVDTCNRLIDLLNDLIDEAENIQDCVPAADRADFDQFLEASRDNRSDLDCG